ncbi:MAG: carboxypeptidase-like regulatory domain-containing protein, partial [bacterium]
MTTHSIRIRFVVAVFGALACCACPARSLRAQSGRDVIRGIVVSDSGRAIAGADVFATRAPDRLVKTSRTDAMGAFEIDFADGTGDYLLFITTPGYSAYRKRLTRSATDSTITVRVSLVRAGAVPVLATVVTRADRQRPDRAPPGGVDVGAAETLTNYYRRVPPDQAGDLAAIASMTPGVLTTATGVSVLGLNPSQNSNTLNGMAFGNGIIPRDIASRIRVSTSTYDPANGWFSGLRTNVQMPTASGLFTRATSHLTLDAPPMQANDPISSRLGQRFTTFNASMGGEGVLL